MSSGAREQTGSPSAAPIAEVETTVVWYTAADGSVTEPNPQWQAFTGQEAADYRGWGWLDAIHPGDRPEVQRSWSESVRTSLPTTLRYRLRRHDGEYRQVVSQAAPVLHGGVLTQWVGFMVDTTRTQQAQAAREATEARLRTLDAIGQATRHLQESDDIMAVTARLLGKSLGATRCAYADVDGDANRFTIRADWAVEGVASSAGVYSLDLFGPQATSNLRRGEHLVVNDVDQELGDEGGGAMFNAIGIKAIVCAGLIKEGRLVAMMAVHQAVPRQWTADQVHLVMEVVDRCWAHIERVRDAALLREQDARKDDFIATLAHELRNPLAPIKYAIALASRNPVPTLVLPKLAIIDRQVSIMARLIDDLLDVSRINRGMIDLKLEDASLDALVAKALEATLGLIEAANHRVTVRVDANITVRVDSARMTQVIGNLLANAAKYTLRGGSIQIDGSARGGRAVLAVRDNGLGVARVDLGRLFQTFTQLPHTKAYAQGGLGLGLAPVKKLVELHGGSVRVESPGLEQGSTFEVDLPLAVAVPSETVSAPGDALQPAINGASTLQRILVVEDNDDGRKTLLELLQSNGYCAVGVATGEEAMLAVSHDPPDLVLLDLGLPGMDGYEVARRLRATYSAEQLTIIALTGWGAAQDRARTHAAGVDEHLTKPIEPSHLERVVRNALEGRGSERITPAI